MKKKKAPGYESYPSGGFLGKEQMIKDADINLANQYSGLSNQENELAMSMQEQEMNNLVGEPVQDPLSKYKKNISKFNPDKSKTIEQEIDDLSAHTSNLAKTTKKIKNQNESLVQAKIAARKALAEQKNMEELKKQLTPSNIGPREQYEAQKARMYGQAGINPNPLNLTQDAQAKAQVDLETEFQDQTEQDRKRQAAMEQMIQRNKIR